MPLFDLTPLVDLSALVSQDALASLGEYVDLRLLAWQAVLTTAGASAILWHAILTYDLFPAPYPPHPPRALQTQSPSASPDSVRSDATLPEASPGGTLPPPGALLPHATDRASPAVGYEDLERLLSYRAIPLDLARQRVRELGGLEATARRLQVPAAVARRLLASERPLPPWVLGTLFDDWQRDDRLRPFAP